MKRMNKELKENIMQGTFAGIQSKGFEIYDG